jgi:hypothetical protein
MVGLTNIPNDEKSYNKKRRKLGLSAKHRAKGSYLVTDFRQRNDGQFEVVTKD